MGGGRRVGCAGIARERTDRPSSFERLAIMPKKQKKAVGGNGAVPPGKVRVRTYRHGLGDCHLLSFTKPDGSLFHMLIDCGVVNRTPKPVPLMTRVAEDIATESNKVLDVLVATHQHTDHLSGFRQAKQFQEALKVKRLWLAWTEDSSNPLGKQIQDQLVRKLNALRGAANKLAGSGSESLPTMNGVLDFFGVAGDDKSSTGKILETLKSRTAPEFHKPGDCFLLPEVPNVRVYVLGPPTSAAQLKITQPDKSKHQSYELPQIAPEIDGLVNALEPNSSDADPELSYPFEKWQRRGKKAMQRDKFFKKHYFNPRKAWRKIENDWLEAAETLALALNDYTNNTSLALAFEFIDSGEVLLFPGDAQIGSWLTWADLIWEWPGANGQKGRMKALGLFKRGVFYKSSHHASYNGTLSGQDSGVGLEEMTHPNLVCVVPVDRAMSKQMGWDRTLPWEPL